MHTDSFPLRRKLRLLGFFGVTLAVAVVSNGLLNRHSQAEKLQSSAARDAVPTVALLMPARAGSAPLELQARIEPWARAPIYARVSGYLKQRKVDIGDQVRAGQLLGEIDMPDLDQQVLQARAELAAARSNLALSASTAQRWQALLAADAVSQQEADEKAGDLAARQSAVLAMQANLQRVDAMQRYTRLVAPFDGVVTARNTEVGALTGVAGTASGSGGANAGGELFVVSDISKLRVYVSVPQRQVGQIHTGSVARLSVPERPGQSFDATVASMAQAINASTGTMLVQLTLDNRGGELLPGGYATVRFAAPALAPALSVPPGALIINQHGIQVGTVRQDQTVQLKPVTIARDLGNVIELAGGLTAADRVIANPPDGLATGDQVRIAAAAKAAP